MTVYSPSSINQFYKCPFKWYLYYILHLQGDYVQNDMALLGTNVHDMIARHYRNLPERIVPHTINRNVDRIFMEYFSPVLEPYKKLVESMLNQFKKYEHKRIKKGYRLPIIVEQKLHNNDFKGIIDFYDGEILIDWKTGKTLSLDNDFKRQAKIYETLVVDNGYPKPKKVGFVTLRNGRFLQLPFTTKGWLLTQKKHMDNMIKRGRFPKNKTPLCNWCPYQILCEFEDIPLFNTVDGVNFTIC